MQAEAEPCCKASCRASLRATSFLPRRLWRNRILSRISRREGVARAVNIKARHYKSGTSLPSRRPCPSSDACDLRVCCVEVGAIPACDAAHRFRLFTVSACCIRFALQPARPKTARAGEIKPRLVRFRSDIKRRRRRLPKLLIADRTTDSCMLALAFVATVDAQPLLREPEPRFDLRSRPLPPPTSALASRSC